MQGILVEIFQLSCFNLKFLKYSAPAMNRIILSFQFLYIPEHCCGLPEYHVRDIMCDVGSAIIYLHEQNNMHRFELTRPNTLLLYWYCHSFVLQLRRKLVGSYFSRCRDVVVISNCLLVKVKCSLKNPVWCQICVQLTLPYSKPLM